jgi:hypothetical protein
LLVVGKVSTLVFGIIIVCISLAVNQLRTVGLFDLSNLIAGGLLMPMALPLIFGLFYKRTPPWSAWSTALAGFAWAMSVKLFLTPATAQRLFGWSTTLAKQEHTDLLLACTTLGTVVLGTTWYFLTSIFYQRSSAEHRASVERFFQNMRTPIDAKAEGIENHDEVLYRLMGLLCLTYGAFIMLLVLIPNSTRGRLCFIACGGVIVVSGALLFRRSRVKPINPADLAEQPVGFTIPAAEMEK